jgi:hypothetical protein
MPDHLRALIAITADTSLSDTVVKFQVGDCEIFWRQMAGQFFYHRLRSDESLCFYRPSTLRPDNPVSKISGKRGVQGLGVAAIPASGIP